MSNKSKKFYLKNVGVGQNQEMQFKNVEQNQEVHVEQIQVDMSNKMMFPGECMSAIRKHKCSRMRAKATGVVKRNKSSVRYRTSKRKGNLFLLIAPLSCLKYVCRGCLSEL